MRRFLSMLLALAMVLSMMAGMCFAVSAESSVITEIRLTGQLPPVPVKGGTAQSFVWTAPADAGYNLAWGGAVVYFNQSEGIQIGEGEIFGFGDYVTQTVLNANEGYIFDPNVQVYLGDVLLADVGFEVSVTEDGDTVWLNRFDVVEPEYMEGASVTGTPIPELQVGDTLPELSYSVPEGANYTVETYWWENNETVPAGTPVEDGNNYTLLIKVRAKEGYAFAFGYPLLINGEEYSFMPVNGSGEGFEYCSFSQDYPFLTPIDKVEFSYDEPVVGQPLPEVTAPEGALYTAHMGWYDCNAQTWIEPGIVVEKGSWYRGDIEVDPVEGYMFTEDTEIWVNGELLTEDYEYRCDIDYDGIRVGTQDYVFMEAVAKVELSYAEPVAGQPLSDVSVPADALYEVEACWYEYGAGDNWKDPGTIAVKGHRYDLVIDVYPAEDYMFTPDTQIFLNGEELTSMEDPLDEFVIGSDDISIDTRIYDLSVSVAKVEMNYAEPVLGQVLSTPTVSGEGALLGDCFWYDYYTEGVAPVGAVAEKGHIYELGVMIGADEGYCFTEDTQLFINGVKMRMGRDVDFNDSTISFYSDNYSFAEQLHSASFTIADPVVGQSFPQAVAPAGANYEVFTYWYDNYTGDEATGTAQANGSYDLEIEIYPNAGYEFAEDTTLTVNGKAPTPGEFYIYTNAIAYRKHYSFLTPVAKVELPAIPELKLGDVLSEFEISGTGAGYAYAMAAMGFDAEGNELTTVVEGGLYYVEVAAIPLEGYEFTEDTVFTVGGKAPSIFAWQDYTEFADYKVFNLGAVQSIDEINLNTSIPTIGQMGGEVTAAAGEGYELGYGWGVSPDGTLENAQEATRPYQAGDHMLLEVGLNVEEGYLFSSDLKINLNGKTYTPVEIMGDPEYISFVIDLGEPQEGPNYNGLVPVDGVWGYYEGGVLQTQYTGLVPYGDLIFYVENGILDFSYTGLAWYNNAWTYVANSQLTEGYTGLVWFNGEWFYVVDSVIDWTFTGLVPYEGNLFYVQNNHLDWSYTGLGYHLGGWYFIQNGLLQLQYSGLVNFNNEWFYVEEGVLTYQYFGMVEYQGNLFYVQASHLDWSYTGLGYHEGNWYFFLNALYMPEYTGLVEFNGSIFYVEEGIVNWNFSGEFEFEGVIYTVENGLVVD